nr:MAG TPA: hypothetical protein [Microviridae sp.]
MFSPEKKFSKHILGFLGDSHNLISVIIAKRF